MTTLALLRLLQPAMGQKGDQLPLGSQIRDVKRRSDADTDRYIVVSEHGCVYFHCRAVYRASRLCIGPPMDISAYTIVWL